MLKSLGLWSRFGSFGEKTTWGSAEIHNIRFMAILCNFWLEIILVKIAHYWRSWLIVQVERGGVLYDSLLIIRRNLHFVDIFFFSFFFVAISNKGRKKGWFPAVFKTLIQVCQQQAKIKCIFQVIPWKKSMKSRKFNLWKSSIWTFTTQLLDCCFLRDHFRQNWKL